MEEEVDTLQVILLHCVLNVLGFLNLSARQEGCAAFWRGSQAAKKVCDVAPPPAILPLLAKLRQVLAATGGPCFNRGSREVNGCNASGRLLYFHAVPSCTNSSTGKSKLKPCHSYSWPPRSSNAMCAVLHVGISGTSLLLGAICLAAVAATNGWLYFYIEVIYITLAQWRCKFRRQCQNSMKQILSNKQVVALRDAI